MNQSNQTVVPSINVKLSWQQICKTYSATIPPVNGATAGPTRRA